MPYRKLFSTLVCLGLLLANHEAQATGEGTSSPVALPLHPYYSLAAFPATVPVARGGSASTTIQVFPGRERKRVDTLSASGLPQGVTASFTRIFPSIYLWTVTLHAASDTIDGSYPVRVIGSGDGYEASVLVTANVSAEAKLLDNSFETPAEWSCSVPTGTSALWSIVTSGAFPDSSPRSGASMASFNSYTAVPGDQSLYRLNTEFAIPAAVSTATLKFWLYHDTFQRSNTTVRACISTDGGNYTGVGPTVPLNDGSTGWTEVNVDLTSYKGQSNVRVGFLGTREQGNVIYLDDVTVVAEAMSSAGMAVTAQPPTVTVAQGTSASASVITTVYGGYKSALSLTAAGLPSGVTATFDAATIPAPGNGSATVTFTASDSVPLGSYPVTISCAGGSGTEQATVTLTVTSTFSMTTSPSSDAYVSVTAVSPATVTVATKVTAGFNSPVALAVHGLPDGVTATPTPATIAAPGGGAATITFTAGTGADYGYYPVYVTASGGGVTQRVGLTLQVGPDLTVLLAVSPASLSMGQHGMKKGLLTLTLASIFKAFQETMTFTVSGLPPEVTATLTPAVLADSGVSTITLTAGPAAPPGSYPVTFTGTVGNFTRQAEMNLTVFAAGAPNFSIPASGTFEFFSDLYSILPEGSEDFAYARDRVVAQRPTLEKELSLTLKGGYDSTFTSVDGVSVMKGPLILRRGKLTLERFIIR